MNPGASRRLWVFDFDGTLSPVVSDRNAARLHPASRAMLKELAANFRNRVAVLSSRTLEDLVARVPIPGLFLGGGSGMEWRLPAGHRFRAESEAQRKVEEARRSVLPALKRISAVPGVELEAKRWSAAVHFRGVPPEALPLLSPEIQELKRHPGIRVFEAAAAVEVQFSLSANKSFGVRRLCAFLRFDPSGGRCFYAGDDENDAAAMRWVISRKGTAIVVGNGIRIPGVRNVPGPAGLARAVRSLADCR